MLTFICWPAHCCWPGPALTCARLPCARCWPPDIFVEPFPQGVFVIPSPNLLFPPYLGILLAPLGCALPHVVLGLCSVPATSAHPPFQCESLFPLTRSVRHFCFFSLTYLTLSTANGGLHAARPRGLSSRNRCKQNYVQCKNNCLTAPPVEDWRARRKKHTCSAQGSAGKLSLISIGYPG